MVTKTAVIMERAATRLALALTNSAAPPSRAASWLRIELTYRATVSSRKRPLRIQKAFFLESLRKTLCASARMIVTLHHLDEIVLQGLLDGLQGEDLRAPLHQQPGHLRGSRPAPPPR